LFIRIWTAVPGQEGRTLPKGADGVVVQSRSFFSLNHHPGAHQEMAPPCPGVLLNVNLNPLCIGFLVGAVIDRAYKDSPKEFFRLSNTHGQEG